MKHEKITPVAVERDEYGYWTHPAYAAYCGDRDFIPADEYNQWLREIGMGCAFTLLEYERDSTAQRRYFETGNADVHDWEPSKPDGEGWFIVSICDSDDGPVCTWMREAK